MQMAMQVKVLGPIGVELEQPAALGGPTQRRALLTLDGVNGSTRPDPGYGR